MNELSYVGGSASPFIDEGDGLTSERERVRMLLSLVAHADGYRTMVGTHNTVWMSGEHGRFHRLVQVWQMSVPAYAIDAQRHVRGFTIFTRYDKISAPTTLSMPRDIWGVPYRMGVNDAHNTVGKTSAPTTLFVSGRL